jgi:hypothetical protein
LTPIEAIRQIDTLSRYEASLLREFYSTGLTGDIIRARRDSYAFSNKEFVPAIKLLTQKFHLSFDDAFEEAKFLTRGELCVLGDFYADNVRGANLRGHQYADACNIYRKFKHHLAKNPGVRVNKYKDALKYTRDIFRLALKSGAAMQAALAEAFNELQQINTYVDNEVQSDVILSRFVKYVNLPVGSKRLSFLMKYAGSGVRFTDLPVNFNEEAQVTFRVLSWKYHLGPLEALHEMKDLSDDKLRFLRKHYHADVNGMTLRVFPHHTAFIEEYMCRWQLPAGEVMKRLGALTPNQLVYLYQFHEYGSTYEMAADWPRNVPYSEKRVMAAKALMIDRKMELALALKEVTTRSEEELAALVQDKHQPVLASICY